MYFRSSTPGSHTVRFQAVRVRRQLSGKCPVCGKRTSRSMTFEQTINPWNKNKDGNPKTYSEIIVELDEKANNWKPDFTHEKCL